jgi:hypothetical protein
VWITNTKFSGLTGESDPLLGNRHAMPGCPVTSDFTVQKDGGCGAGLRGYHSSSRCAGARISFCRVCARYATSPVPEIRRNRLSWRSVTNPFRARIDFRVML